MREDWPITARVGAAILSRPRLVEALLRGRAPIEVDGRVLDRRAQLLLVMAEQAEARRASRSRGQFDPVAMRDDGASYAEALRSAGVEVEYGCYDDQVHGFMGMGINPVSLALATEVSEAAGRLVRRSAATSSP
jgi:acetyl esterase/lipase